VRPENPGGANQAGPGGRRPRLLEARGRPESQRWRVEKQNPCATEYYRIYPYRLCPSRYHGSAEHGRGHSLDTIQQRQTYGGLGGHHRHILETDPAGPRDIRNEPIAHDLIDLRGERMRLEELADHAKSECSKAICRT
jgi:hypothetical protein